MIAEFHKGDGDTVALNILMALEDAAIPVSVDFLPQVLQEGEERFEPYARRALQASDTPESRKAPFDASHTEQKHD